MNRHAAHLETLTPGGRDLCTGVLPRLDEALARLDDRERAIIAAHFLEGRSYAEIAEGRRQTKTYGQKRACAVAKVADAATNRSSKLEIKAPISVRGLSHGEKSSASTDLDR